jgi:transcription elongation factor SPT5
MTTMSSTWTTTRRRTNEFDWGELDARGVAGGDSIHIVRQGQLPDVNSPQMWQVKCKVGSEREIVVAVMRKCMALSRAGRRPLMTSVVCQDHLKGVFYVEAKKEAHVADVLEGVRDVFMWKRALVPLKEMPSVLAVSKKGSTLERDAWVRVMRGPYRGDLAQVVDPNYGDMGNKAMLKLAPRLRLTKDAAGSRRQKERAPVRFFNADQMRDLGLEFNSARGESGETEYHYQGNTYDLDGYMLKVVSFNTIEWHNVHPTLDEIQNFQIGARDRARRDAADGINDDDDAATLATSRGRRWAVSTRRRRARCAARRRIGPWCCARATTCAWCRASSAASPALSRRCRARMWRCIR